MPTTDTLQEAYTPVSLSQDSEACAHLGIQQNNNCGKNHLLSHGDHHGLDNGITASAVSSTMVIASSATITSLSSDNKNSNRKQRKPQLLSTPSWRPRPHPRPWQTLGHYEDHGLVHGITASAVSSTMALASSAMATALFCGQQQQQ